MSVPVERFYIDLCFILEKRETIPFTISIPSVMDTCFHMCYNVKQVAIDNSSCLTLWKFVKQMISILLYM